jgi:hypothetical protein
VISLLAVGPSGIEGTGFFAVEALSRGTVLLQLDDSRVLDSDHPLRPEDGESARHRDFLPDGTVVLMQDPEKYVNHSCDPNCYVYSAGRKRYLLTRRAVGAGEELLIDYALNAVGGEYWECHCGAAQCRGYHECDFFALSEQIQREYLPYLDPWFAAVHAKRIGWLLAESKYTGM